MPVATIPLAGQINSRTAASGYTKDQVFKACVIKTLSNSVTGKATVYVEKRGALTEQYAGGSVIGTAVFNSPSTGHTISAKGAASSTIYDNNTNVGVITTTIVRHISETIIGGVTFYLLSASDSTTSSEGWYLASNSFAVTAYTADGNNSTTITDIKIAGVQNTTGLYPGQLLAAASNIVAGTRVVSVNAGAFSAVLDTATTGGAFADLAITKTPVAKMNDVDFPTNIVGEFIELSGTIYIMDKNGIIWGSDLNSVSSWSALNFITANLYTDGGTGLAKDGDKIIGFGASSAEWFYNAGNAVGSLLSKIGRSMPIGASASTTSPVISNISSAGQIVCWSVKTGLTRQVWMLDGGSPKKISTSYIESLINVTNIKCLTSFNYSGGRYVFISFVNTTNYNLMYSLETGLWTDAAFPDCMIVSALPGHVYGLGGTVFIAAVESVLTNGSVYMWTETTFSGADTPAATIQMAGMDFGTDARKFVPNIWLDADTQASGTCTLEASDNDFASFVTLGTFDMTKHEKRITRCGSHTGERSYRLTHNANTAFRGRSLRIEYTVGT